LNPYLAKRVAGYERFNAPLGKVINHKPRFSHRGKPQQRHEVLGIRFFIVGPRVGFKLVQAALETVDRVVFAFPAAISAFFHDVIRQLLAVVKTLRQRRPVVEPD
jgi:hypothetical protein